MLTGKDLQDYMIANNEYIDISLANSLVIVIERIFAVYNYDTDDDIKHRIHNIIADALKYEVSKNTKKITQWIYNSLVDNF